MPNVSEIESQVAALVERYPEGVDESFIYDLILAYGLPKASVTRLQNGTLNLATRPGEISWKGKLLYKSFFKGELNIGIALATAKNIKHKERFVILTDGDLILCVDTKNSDTLETSFKDLPKHYAFFLPWAGIEKTEYIDENPADVRAARKMAKLFDEIRKDNEKTSISPHDLNLFLSRLLFCFFAEDTGIFTDNLFVNTLSKSTHDDGSDLDEFLRRLFVVLDTPADKRNGLPDYLEKFPYVNGGLFRTRIEIPKFSAHSRNKIIECGELDWKDINPDIFGSMFQTVIDEEQRSNLGQHYTSVPNIMKVIEPLFLNELREEFEIAGSNVSRLKKLLMRIRGIRVFDPACGSGNFLIIAYKELRKLEMDILLKLGELGLTGIHLDHFYGIEIDDFACETAKLSLWLTEHQMNVEFMNKTGVLCPTLPLKEAGHIVKGNACRLEWEDVCPKNEGDEIFVLGNPPYDGSRKQTEEQKNDMDYVLSDELKTYRDLDYIACWFYKGAKYIEKTDSRLGFVSTNSICQGLQVSLLWPYIFDKCVEISFCHTSFKWTNNAQYNAGVTVAVIGLAKKNSELKSIYTGTSVHKVKNINAYLIDASNVIVERRNKPLSNFPKMAFGNMPADGNHLILTQEESKKLIKDYPDAKQFVKILMGAKEFIRGEIRLCLWIPSSKRIEAETIPEIANRIEQVRKVRKESARPMLAQTPHLFAQITAEPSSNQFLVPRVSSERRDYVPIGVFGIETVISDSAQVIRDAEPWLFSVINSRMHMVWLRNVGGKMKTDYRYAKDLVYNTFPFPHINEDQKNILKRKAFEIIGARENHPGKTLAELYNPESMPDDLKTAHEANDLAIEKLYRAKPFSSDEERLEFLFKLYEQMIKEEQDKETFFEAQKKSSKRAKKGLIGG
ncbi:class I SAM-dependent DNA methyltransferase [Fibrobacter sp. UBA4309]|uniref:class I SAM-dependent DNA methyltransferase n=1 Tax=Fibrobacter sp. UBA4309 TaxID=1946537 RepID=UPI0025C70735|nr:DNA methyltransferase [Fibrobacter sp. UBA4309]